MDGSSRNRQRFADFMGWRFGFEVNEVLLSGHEGDVEFSIRSGPELIEYRLTERHALRHVTICAGFDDCRATVTFASGASRVLDEQRSAEFILTMCLLTNRLYSSSAADLPPSLVDAGIGGFEVSLPCGKIALWIDTGSGEPRFAIINTVKSILHFQPVGISGHALERRLIATWRREQGPLIQLYDPDFS